MRADLVIEGGGVKLPGLVGAVTALEEHGFQPYRVAGSSAGALVGSLVAAGYTGAELTEIVMGLNFQHLLDRVAFGTKAYNFLAHRGIYPGRVLEDTLRRLLRAKGVRTFGDLCLAGATKHKYKLRVFVSDISYERLISFPEDSHLYRLAADEVDVAWAVRASCSIPWFFQPAVVDGCYLVDGGLLSNFPIATFDSPDPHWPTFGLLLQERHEQNYMTLWPHTFASAIVNTVLTAHDKLSERPNEFKFRTIAIPIGGVKATDFSIDNEHKRELHFNGHHAAVEFLRDWSWPKYLHWAKTSRGVQ